jgi:hypothetical protein
MIVVRLQKFQVSCAANLSQLRLIAPFSPEKEKFSLPEWRESAVFYA